jgi:hypothetical protein
LPAFSAVCTLVIFPNVDGDDTSVAGGAKLRWFGRLVNVLSNLIRNLSPREKVFDTPPAIATVPGPTRLPTAQLPIGPLGIALNAFISK